MNKILAALIAAAFTAGAYATDTKPAAASAPKADAKAAAAAPAAKAETKAASAPAAKKEEAKK